MPAVAGLGLNMASPVPDCTSTPRMLNQPFKGHCLGWTSPSRLWDHPAFLSHVLFSNCDRAALASKRAPPFLCLRAASKTKSVSVPPSYVRLQLRGKSSAVLRSPKRCGAPSVHARFPWMVRLCRAWLFLALRGGVGLVFFLKRDFSGFKLLCSAGKLLVKYLYVEKQLTTGTRACRGRGNCCYGSSRADTRHTVCTEATVV